MDSDLREAWRQIRAAVLASVDEHRHDLPPALDVHGLDDTLDYIDSVVEAMSPPDAGERERSMKTSAAHALERIEDGEDGAWSVLIARDAQGEIELDRWPLALDIASRSYVETGDAALEAAWLNAHPNELANAMAHARACLDGTIVP